MRELPGERNNARNNAMCTQARKTTHNQNDEDRDKWRKYVHGVANSGIKNS